QVVRRRDEHVGHVEVHPVLSIYLRRHETLPDEATQYRPGLRLDAEILPGTGGGERRPMLLPPDEIPRRRHREPRYLPIPLCVGEHILTIIALDDARILDAAWPLVFPLRVVVGIQHRLGASGEVQSVGALGETDS